MRSNNKTSKFTLDLTKLNLKESTVRRVIDGYTVELSDGYNFVLSINYKMAS